MCWNYASTTLTLHQPGWWRAEAVWEAHADALRPLAGRAIGTLDADDERMRLAAAAAILKATALQNAGRPGGLTSEAAIRMDWMLSEGMDMR